MLLKNIKIIILISQFLDNLFLHNFSKEKKNGILNYV